MRHKIFAAIAAASLACASAPAASADLVIAMPNWPSGQATANILKVAIAEKFGLDAEVREMGTCYAFAGLDPARSTSVRKSGCPISTISSGAMAAEGQECVLSRSRGAGMAGPVRDPRCGQQARHQGRRRPKDPGKDRRARHRWRRQGRVLDRRRDLVVDGDRAHPGQQLRLCQAL